MKKIHKYTLTFIFSALIAVIAVLCWYLQHRKVRVETANRYVYLRAKADSTQKVIEYKTKVTTKYVTKWLHVRYDSIIPCNEKLLICDTVIRADSSLIASYQALDTIQKAAICELRNNLTDTCKYYQKEIKKQKRQKWVAIGAAILLAAKNVVH